MIAVALLTWWYGDGWRRIMQAARQRTKRVSDSFSVPSLLKTLFAPWRRIYTDKGDNINDRIKALGDNFVSRLVGFGVRSIVLVAAGSAVIGISAAGLIQTILWPFVPPAIVTLIILGLLP